MQLLRAGAAVRSPAAAHADRARWTCRFVPLLFALLGSESESLRAGAVEVLTEVVSKRMDAEAKLRLLQQLGLVPVAAAWHQGLPGDAEGELPLKCAKLLSAVCVGAAASRQRAPENSASQDCVARAAPARGLQSCWTAGKRWRTRSSA